MASNRSYLTMAKQENIPFNEMGIDFKVVFAMYPDRFIKDF